MKYCPTCETRYDEEILRFCMKDGTPLVEEEPKFIEMPSENVSVDDDPGEVTIVRKRGEVPIPPPEMDEAGELKPPAAEYRQEPVFLPKDELPARFVIPTEQPRPQARVIPPYQPPPKSHTLRTVVLTIFGTLFLLAIGAFGFWLVAVRNGNGTNSNANNANVNANVNLNTNLGFDSNFNFNSSGSYNYNTNVNANSKTPTPTPKPSPSVTPSPTPDDDEPATPTPTPTLRPSPTVPSMAPLPRTTPTPPRMLPTNRPANRPSNTQ